MKTLKRHLAKLNSISLKRTLFMSLVVTVIASCSIVPYYDLGVIEQIEETTATADRFYLLMEMDSTSEGSPRNYEAAEPFYYDLILDLRKVNRANEYRVKSEASTKQVNLAIGIIKTQKSVHENMKSLQATGLIKLHRSQTMDALFILRETESRLPKKSN
jgi:hypothetical protein